MNGDTLTIFNLPSTTVDSDGIPEENPSQQTPNNERGKDENMA